MWNSSWHDGIEWRTLLSPTRSDAAVHADGEEIWGTNEDLATAIHLPIFQPFRHKHRPLFSYCTDCIHTLKMYSQNQSYTDKLSQDSASARSALPWLLGVLWPNTNIVYAFVVLTLQQNTTANRRFTSHRNKFSSSSTLIISISFLEVSDESHRIKATKRTLKTYGICFSLTYHFTTIDEQDFGRLYESNTETHPP